VIITPDTPEETAPEEPKPVYSIYWLFCLTLIILIYSTARDTLSLSQRTNQILGANSRGSEVLRRSGEKVAFIQSMHRDLEQIAPSDPVAAQIVSDFFPASSSDRIDPSPEASP
jgi:hypothetical protein